MYPCLFTGFQYHISYIAQFGEQFHIQIIQCFSDFVNFDCIYASAFSSNWSNPDFRYFPS